MTDLRGVGALRAERLELLATVESLSDDDVDSGPTLCSGWAPRDVLAHLLQTGNIARYLAHGLRINAVNAKVVAASRALPRQELTRRARQWAEQPPPVDAALARFLLGDLAVHHQDIRRGLGLPPQVSARAAGAIFREGVLLSTGTRRSLLRYRVEPTTPGGRALGRGRVVRGPAELLGLWLAGRRGVEPELEFSG